MADGDNSTQARWSINSATQGNKRLRKMVDYDVADGPSSEATNEVGSDEPTGIDDTPGAYTLTFNFKQTKGAKPDVDWLYLLASKEWVAFTKNQVGARRMQYPKCRIVTYNETGDSDGQHTYTVTCIAMSLRPL